MRRVPCVTWPCRRCEEAGRTSWRSREGWHWERRDRWYGIAERSVLGLALMLSAAVLWGLL